MENTILIWYLAAVNLITFTAFGIDKWKAVHKQWRIPEKTLLGLSFIGGAAGGLVAMHLFHHKTRKRKFAVGVPLMLVLHLAMGYFVMYMQP
nr:DUF1294 domain-containing protein [uncultured Blautia sp.]